MQLSNAVRNYGDSWRAVMHLVRSGYSWSGNERNCVFLCTSTNETRDNTPQFANVSAVTGLDFPDDGRGLAVTDWDHDGDLDLWFRNRTAPRLRLMRNLTNEISPDDQHISLRLVGTTCNRDAIGARAELVLNAIGTHRQRLVRSVRAGDAFLSQSSKWLHFGIKSDASVRQLIVTWPGGQQERFQGLSVGARYEVKQGTGQAVRLKQRERVQLVSRSYEPLAQTAAARIVLPGRVAMAPIDARSDDRPDPVHLDFGDRPALVTFWTSSCPNCRKELTDLARHRSEFEQADLNVVAVCLDGLENQNNATVEELNDAKAFLKDIDFPHRVAWTTRETIERLRHFQNALFSKYPSFVVPLSFLVDRDGQVVCIYRGAYSHDTLLQDRSIVDMADETLRTLATPLVGTWITKPATRSQFAEFVGGRMIDKEPRAAIRYYEAALAAEQDASRQRALQGQIKVLRQVTERGGK